MSSALLVAATVLSAWGRWFPLASWLHSVPMGLLVAGAALHGRQQRSTAAILIVSCILLQCVSALHAPGPLLLTGGLAYSGVALLVERWLDARMLRRLGFYLVTLGLVLAAHAVVSYMVFRAIGGGYDSRPPISNGWVAFWVFPYYCGLNERGWRLCGIFMNDNLFGVWCACLLPIVLRTFDVSDRRWQRGFCLAAVGLLLACVAWSYSRTAFLVLGMVLLLELRQHGRWVAGISGLGLLLALPYWTGLDLMRFLHPLNPHVYPADRAISWKLAGVTLSTFNLLGAGPGAAGLRDAEFAKVIIETGWLGALSYAALLGWVLRRGNDAFRHAALAMLVAGVSADLLESPHMAVTFWLLAGCCLTDRKPPSTVRT